MKRLLMVLVLMAATLVVVPAAGAVTINVNTTADEYSENPAACSLREAISSANNDVGFGGCTAGAGADTIALPAGEYRITRAGAEEDGNATGDFDIGGGSLTIEPVNAQAKVVVSGNGLDRIFDQQADVSLSLRHLHIVDGAITAVGDDGGAVRNAVGNLTLEGVTISGNSTQYSGGGIAVYDTLAMTNSTISGNSAGQNGGGIYFPSSTGSVRSSTITGNTADADANESGDGGGFADTAATSVSFLNTINAGNEDLSPVTKGPDCASGPFFFPDYVLSTQAMGPAPCLVGFNPGTNQVVADPRIGPLADNGGQTPTHALLEDSPAIGTGGPAGTPDECPATDQTGRERDLQACDIGAVQYVAPAPPPLEVVVKINRVKPKVLKLKRGKKAKAVSVRVSSVGAAGALDAKLCLKPGKKVRKSLKFKGKLCRNLGALVGARTVKFRVAAKKKARKKTFRVKAVLSATDATSRSRPVKVRVK